MTRSLNADPKISGMFGNGWSFAYESTLKSDCNGAYLKKGSGQGLFYSSNAYCQGGLLNPPIVLTPPEGIFDTLTDMGGGVWLWEEKESHLTYRYDFIKDTASSHPVVLRDGLIVPGATRLTSVTDPNGNAVRISHNANGTIQSITDAAGRSTNFESDTNKHCTRMTSPDGRAATFSYDANGNLIRTVDFAGNETIYEYDPLNYATSMTAGGKTTRFGYQPYSGDADSARKIASVTDAAGQTTQYGGGYSSKVSVTDPRGGVSSYTNDAGKTNATIDPLGYETIKTYEGGLPVVLADANYHAWRLTYDSRGNVLSRLHPSYHRTTFTYDLSSNPLTRTNPLGETWSYGYDTKHNLISKTSPLQHTDAMTYDAAGRLTGVTDALGNTAAFSYDAFGNVTRLTDPLGHSIQFSYDPFGLRRTSKTDPLGRTTQYVYDGNDRLTRVTHPDGSFRSIAYDCCAMNAITDENGHTTAYARNQLLSYTRITDPLGGITGFQYDENNNLVRKTDANGKTTATTYDAANRPITSTNPKNATVTLGYDAVGNLTSLKDERGKETVFSYDFEDRLTSVRDPLGNATVKIWNAAGRLLTAVNARQQPIDFAYDLDARLTGKSYSGTGMAALAYDAAGNLQQVNDPTGMLTYGYDSLKRVTSISYPDGLSLTQAYDAAGNVTALSYPGGLVVQYSYDLRNRVERISWGNNSIDLTYDHVGNVLSEIRSNGTKTDYSYDANDRFTRISHSSQSTAFADMAYTRDPAGNTVRETSTLPLQTSLAGKSITGTYNDLNQIVRWGPDSYGYDADGNLTGLSGSQSLDASYDHENRLIAITRNGITTTYSYNGLGQRTRAITGTQTSHYYYDASGRLLFQTDGSGQIISYYLHAGHRLVAMGTPAGGYYYYHYDQIGNTLAMTDGGGDVVAAYAYSPFGEITDRSGALANPFTYVGAYSVMDEGNGLYFMKNRYYDAVTGKFIQKDPIGFKGGINLYAYVRNNPVDRIDPKGLEDKPKLKPIDFIPGAGYVKAIEEWNKGNVGRAIWETAKETAGPYGNMADAVEKLFESGIEDCGGKKKKRGEDTVYDIRWDQETGSFSGLTPEALGKEPERDPDELIDLSDGDYEESGSAWEE